MLRLRSVVSSIFEPSLPVTAIFAVGLHVVRQLSVVFILGGMIGVGCAAFVLIMAAWLSILQPRGRSAV